MRQIERPDQPPRWAEKVSEPGRRWLGEAGDSHRLADRPKDCWRKCAKELRESFGNVCCYTVMRTYTGTADHIIPWHELRGTERAELAYDWNNICYADGWANAKKGRIRFPDPFEVRDDWFFLHFPSLELRATAHVPPARSSEVDCLLSRVANHQRVIDARRDGLVEYRSGSRPYENLILELPLLARALRRHPEHLLPADRARLEAGLL